MSGSGTNSRAKQGNGIKRSQRVWRQRCDVNVSVAAWPNHNIAGRQKNTRLIVVACCLGENAAAKQL